MTFNCENKCFYLLRAGVKAAKIHNDPGNSPAPFVFFSEFTKIRVYIIEPFQNCFNTPFPISTINCGGDHHSPQSKRREIHIKESGHLLILILHCLDNREDI